MHPVEDSVLYYALFICHTVLIFVQFVHSTDCFGYRSTGMSSMALASTVQAGHLQHFAKPSAAGTITHPLSNGTPSHESQLLRVGGYMS